MRRASIPDCAGHAVVIGASLVIRERPHLVFRICSESIFDHRHGHASLSACALNGGFTNTAPRSLRNQVSCRLA